MFLSAYFILADVDLDGEFNYLAHSELTIFDANHKGWMLWAEVVSFDLCRTGLLTFVKVPLASVELSNPRF